MSVLGKANSGLQHKRPYPHELASSWRRYRIPTGIKAPWGFAEVLPYNLVGPMTRRPPFPSRGCGLTEVLGFAGSGGCSGVGFSFWEQREAPLRREGSPAVLAPSVPGVGGMMTPLAHHRSAGCHRWLRLAGGCVCILSFLCLNKGSVSVR